MKHKTENNMSVNHSTCYAFGIYNQNKMSNCLSNSITYALRAGSSTAMISIFFMSQVLKAPELEPAQPMHKTLLVYLGHTLSMCFVSSSIRDSSYRISFTSSRLTYLATHPGFLFLTKSHFLAVSSVMMLCRLTGGWGALTAVATGIPALARFCCLALRTSKW